jgi:hypothetical protein
MTDPKPNPPIQPDPNNPSPFPPEPPPQPAKEPAKPSPFKHKPKQYREPTHEQVKDYQDKRGNL